MARPVRHTVRTTRTQSHQIGKMNGLEADYAQTLQFQQLAGVVKSWHFEKLKLRLAPSTFYTPDFFVELVAGDFEVHEVKGFWRDDARVKLKVAAELFDFWKFVAITRDKSGTWLAEEIG